MNTPIRLIAFAMNTSNSFLASYSENPLWYQQFILRHITIVRGGPPILDFVVDFDAAVNCRLYVTTMKTMNFQNVIPSFPIEKSKNNYVLLFDLT